MIRAIRNLTRNQVLAQRVRLCKSCWSRLKGLLGTTGLGQDEACWIDSCNAIHTFGMRYPLDVYFLDKKNTVVAILKNLEPNRISPFFPAACSVLEFQSGFARECHIGDRLDPEVSSEALVSH